MPNEYDYVDEDCECCEEPSNTVSSRESEDDIFRWNSPPSSNYYDREPVTDLSKEFTRKNKKGVIWEKEKNRTWKNKKGVIWEKEKNRTWTAVNKGNQFLLEKKKSRYVLSSLFSGEPKPYENINVCRDCFQIHKIDNLAKDGNYYLCKKCLKSYNTCNICNKLHHVQQIIHSQTTKKLYCYNCFDKELFNCYICGKEYKIKDAKEHDGRRVCNHCYVEHFVECNRCRHVIKRENGREYNNTIICSECYKRYAAIKSYNYIPSKYKKSKLEWDNELYLGVEIEVETKDMRKPEFEDWARKTMNFLKRKKLSKYFYIKHDGTVNGFELVAHPLTLQYIHKNIQFSHILKWFRDNEFTSYKDGRCGLHVHLNRGFFKPHELQKIRLFYSTNREWIDKFSKREKNKQYCHSENLHPTHFIKNGLRQDGKYWAIRMAPQGKATVELRSFRGTLSYPRFIATLQFSDALAHFIKEVGVMVLTKTKSWNYFIEWCKKSHTYPHFIKYITNRDELFQPEI